MVLQSNSSMMALADGAESLLCRMPSNEEGSVVDTNAAAAAVVSAEHGLLLHHIDTVCPAWIEVCVHRGGYTKMYAMVYPYPFSSANTMTTWNVAPLLPFSLWLAQLCEDWLLALGNKSLQQEWTKHFPPHLSKVERLRRALGLIFSLSGSLSSASATTTTMGTVNTGTMAVLLPEQLQALLAQSKGTKHAFLHGTTPAWFAQEQS